MNEDSRIINSHTCVLWEIFLSPDNKVTFVAWWSMSDIPHASSQNAEASTVFHFHSHECNETVAYSADVWILSGISDQVCREPAIVYS